MGSPGHAASPAPQTTRRRAHNAGQELFTKKRVRSHVPVRGLEQFSDLVPVHSIEPATDLANPSKSHVVIESGSPGTHRTLSRVKTPLHEVPATPDE
jgi:hypothetical protein